MAYNKTEMISKPHVQLAQELFDFFVKCFGVSEGSERIYEFYRTTMHKAEGMSENEWNEKFKELDEFCFWIYHLEEDASFDCYYK